MRTGAAAAKAAKVGIAFVVGPAAGLREAGVALVDGLVKSDPDLKVALAQVTSELTGLARARGYSYEQSRSAFRAMQDLMEFHKVSVDELAALGFDSVRATSMQLAKGASVMRTLSQDESNLTEAAVLSLYRAMLANPKLLPGRDEAFQRRVLAETERLALPAQARAQPVEHLRARGLEPAVGVPLSSRGSPAKAIQARAGSEIFSFVDREQRLESLCDWLGDEDPFAIAVIGGRGGSGKTRLAVELCLKAQDSGWLTGLLQPEPPADALPALADADAMRLVVIDYAETRIAQLVSLLPLLWARATRLYPVRVVLLIRTRPAGARDWRSPLTATGDANLGNLLDDADVFEIESTDLTDRYKVYEQVAAGLYRRFAGRNGTAPHQAAGSVATPDLSSTVFDNPLMVVIAAYLAVHHDPGSSTPPPRSRPELLDELLSHEAGFWNRRWSEAQLGVGDATLQARVVALATLGGARDEDQATALLTLLPDLAAEPSSRIRAIARWAHNLYADTGTSWWNSLQPDVLGEHLIATSVGPIPSVIAGVLDLDDAPVLTRTLDALARAAADHLGLNAVLRPLLAERLSRLCRTAVEQAAQVRDGWHTTAMTTLAGSLERTLQVVRIYDPHALVQANNQLLHDSDLVLDQLSLTAIDQLTALRRRLAECNPATHEPHFAAALNNLSIALARAGRLDEALTAIVEAVAIYRRLADANPATHEPGLASSLNTLSIRLAEAGRRDEALTAIEQGVAIYRRLANANPATYEPALARSSDTLSVRLAGAGRLDEALTAIVEVVAIYRRLADANPGAYEPALTSSLHNLSIRLAEAGRLDEALTAIVEAVAMRRRLADANPATYEPALTSSLHNLSIRLAEAGRLDEALTAIVEAVAIYRRLADARPATYEPALAGSLNTLSIRLAEACRLDEALTAIEQGVAIYRRLADARPATYEPALTSSLNTLSIRLAEAGRLDEALIAIEQGVAIYRRLADAHPAAFEPALAGSLDTLSARLAEAGRLDEALTAIEQGVAIYRRLADAHPARSTADLANSLQFRALLLRRVGDEDDGLSH